MRGSSVTCTGKYHDGLSWIFKNMDTQESMNDACMNHYEPSGDQWKCQFAQYMSAFIKAPLFPLQSKFDSWQITQEIVNTSDTALINEYGRAACASSAVRCLLYVLETEPPVCRLRMKGSFCMIARPLGTSTSRPPGKNLTEWIEKSVTNRDGNGAFLDACYHHTGQWNRIDIDGSLSSEAMSEWWFSGAGNVTYYNQDESYPCNNCCSS